MTKYLLFFLVLFVSCSKKNTSESSINFQGGELKVYHQDEILIDINQYTNGSRIKINLPDGGEVSLVLDEKLRSLDEIFIVKVTPSGKKFLSVDAEGRVEYH